jgi:clan AA aspartic protease (TIGR02281 family)
LREPVLQVVGRQLFKEFRQSLGVARPIKVVGSRYVVGAGCTPHFCCGGASIFVLDTVDKTAWALQMQNQDCKPGNGKARMWGTLSALDVVPKRELSQWLTQNGLTWNKVVVREPLQATPSPKPAAADGDPLQFSAPASNKPRPSTVQGREVAMVRQGGTYAVPVQINGAVTLDFLLDSGATDVSIPADVFTTLVDAGTITAADTIGSATYRLADGSIKKSPTFNIRSLKVGATVVTNVKATVAGDTGPLLLGMSFLGRFPAWSVDNSRHVLILK